VGEFIARLTPEPYVVVTVPRSLEASTRVAVAELYQPFFVEWAGDGIVLVAREVEWERLAARFPGAVTQTGFRLISLVPGGPAAGAGWPPEPADPAALVRVLERRGVSARLLRSFYRDHLLVAAERLTVCLEVLAALLGVRPDAASGEESRPPQ
jgi:hypothetical protein